VFPAAQPTPVIAGLPDAPALGFLDRRGRYHSALAPFSVRSHWQPSEVGGPDPSGRNDRFTAPDGLCSIDVIAVPNPHQVDTAQAEQRLWAYLVETGMQPHLLGRMRVLGAWVPLVGLTNLDTGQPHARIVFATTQDVWVVDLATWPRTLPSDVHELAYMAATFQLEPLFAPRTRQREHETAQRARWRRQGHGARL
jgi:hypothetical protein